VVTAIQHSERKTDDGIHFTRATPNQGALNAGSTFLFEDFSISCQFPSFNTKGDFQNLADQFSFSFIHNWKALVTFVTELKAPCSMCHCSLLYSSHPPPPPAQFAI
jgi:hypothetical protein